jgi:two-component system, LuxR family, response regulator FixJ
MPDMNGLDLLEKLRARNIALPAILITGHPSLSLRQRAAEAKVLLIEKPLFGNGLVDAIRDVLAAKPPDSIEGAIK